MSHCSIIHFWYMSRLNYFMHCEKMYKTLYLNTSRKLIVIKQTLRIKTCLSYKLTWSMLFPSSLGSSVVEVMFVSCIRVKQLLLLIQMTCFPCPTVYKPTRSTGDWTDSMSSEAVLFGGLEGRCWRCGLRVTLTFPYRRIKKKRKRLCYTKAIKSST